VNSPSKTPKKVITKAALAHGHFVEIAPKKTVSKESSFSTMSATHPTSEEVEESSFHDFDVSDLDESEAASVLSDNEYIADNFYTRLYLAEKVKKLSDQEIRITGTCRLNVVDKVNKVGVKAAIDLLRDKE
jgi:hypothetical protein